jgi:hypothetical protein
MLQSFPARFGTVRLRVGFSESIFVRYGTCLNMPRRTTMVANAQYERVLSHVHTHPSALPSWKMKN